MSKKVLAWHFIKDDGTMRDGTKAEVGKTYRLARGTQPVLCTVGFHGSVRALDALQYAPGSMVCRVEIGGVIVRGDDKLCGTTRKVLSMVDATTTLHEFSAWAAEWILDGLENKGHRVDPRSRAAIEAKRQWLRGEITDGELAAAWTAARTAARDAARTAARTAAWTAAGAAARTAARTAAWTAAWTAAGAVLNARLEEMLLAVMA